MKQEDKETVAEWVGRRKTPIQLSQASIIPGSFALEIVALQ